jgi:recombination associated protein RdgC
MGFLKGTLSFVRYRVAGNLPSDFREFSDRQLKRFAFQEPLQGGEKSLGWTSLENPLDTGFSHVSHSVGDYLAFVLRIDRKVVPPSLLMIRILEREKKLQEEKNRKKLYKNEREEIRNAVLLSCLSQIPPTPSFFEVCWNLSEGTLLFGGSGKKVLEDFEDLFKRTFQLKIAPLLPWESGDEAAEKRDDDGSTAGLDFLSWLWFKSEERGGSILVPGMGDVGLIFVRRLVLFSGEGEYAETVTCQGMHADLREGKAALREGKKIREARLRVDIGTEQWECTLKAETFRYQSMRLPVTMKFSEEDEAAGMEGRFLERIHLVEMFLRTVDRIFQHFLELRLSPRWEGEEVPRIQKWLEE